MTPEEKQQYLDGLRADGGKALSGLETVIWKVVNETADSLKFGRDQLEELRSRCIELEKSLLQLTGRHQGAIDLLCRAEEQRRADSVGLAAALSRTEKPKTTTTKKPLDQGPAFKECTESLSESTDGSAHGIRRSDQ